MIKKILPAMIGAALVGGVANVAADVTAMGHIDTSYVYTDIDVSGVDETHNLVCTTCSFGFKGSEDLGNGLAAIFKIDFQYDTTIRNNETGLTDRDQWLGLKSGNLGQVRVGTISTSYKSHGAMLDPVYRTSVQGRDIGLQSALQRGAGEAGQGRATSTIRYDSPTFAGITGTAHYTLQDDNGIDDTDNPWGIGGQWKAGGFLVFADYITNDAGGDDDAYKVGGRFGFDKFAVFAQYEVDGGLISTNTFGTGGSGDGADVWFIGGTAGFGNNLIYAAYGQGDDTDGLVDGEFDVNTEYDAWEIVGIHSLSKRSKIYAGYAGIDPDEGNDRVDLFTLGMKHTF
ncbi:MAG: porin [Pseudomonadota bacterium]